MLTGFVVVLLPLIDIELELAKLELAVRQLVTAVEVVKVLPRQLLFIGASMEKKKN